MCRVDWIQPSLNASLMLLWGEFFIVQRTTMKQLQKRRSSPPLSDYQWSQESRSKFMLQRITDPFVRSTEKTYFEFIRSFYLHRLDFSEVLTCDSAYEVLLLADYFDICTMRIKLPCWSCSSLIFTDFPFDDLPTLLRLVTWKWRELSHLRPKVMLVTKVPLKRSSTGSIIMAVPSALAAIKTTRRSMRTGREKSVLLELNINPVIPSLLLTRHL